MEGLGTEAGVCGPRVRSTQVTARLSSEEPRCRLMVDRAPVPVCLGTSWYAWLQLPPVRRRVVAGGCTVLHDVHDLGLVAL